MGFGLPKATKGAGIVADPEWKAEFFKNDPILSKWYLGVLAILALFGGYAGYASASRPVDGPNCPITAWEWDHDCLIKELTSMAKCYFNQICGGINK